MESSSPIFIGCSHCSEPVKAHWKLCPVCGSALEKKKPNDWPTAVALARSEPEMTSAKEFELIPASDVVWGEKLGEGSYGVVFRGKVRGTPVALKSVKTFEQFTQASPHAEQNAATIKKKIAKQIEVLKQEQAIVSSCHNPNICLYLGATTDPRGNMVLVSELMETDLDRYIATKKPQPSLYNCMQIAFKIAMGMSWIEGELIHGDLKPSNVLLGQLNSNGLWTSK